jgi:CheY-like chemotaxis protein
MAATSKPLRVLLVEDSERDAALLKLQLRRGGYQAEVHRVDTRPGLDAALAASRWDLVVSDFNLPGFDAFAALQAVRASGHAIPFVVMSGEFHPTALERIKAASIRYVYKDQLAALIAIIDETMREGA